MVKRVQFNFKLLLGDFQALSSTLILIVIELLTSGTASHMMSYTSLL